MIKQSIFLLIVAFFSISTGYAQQEGYVSSSGADIYYRTFGEGSPLLIINGGPGMNSDGFVSIANTLANGYQTIIFDQRGTGKSSVDTPNDQTITMNLMVKDMEAIREHLGLDSWVVFGQSFGGMLAAYYASINPDKIDGLILSASGGLSLSDMNNIDVMGKLTSQQRDSVNFWNAMISSGDTTHYARYQRGKFLAHAYVHDTSHIPVIAERLTQANFIINALVFRDLTRIQYDTKSALASFQKPVLIIHGEDDIIDTKVPKEAHAIFPNSTLVLLKNSAHYGWLDRRETYLEEVFGFLKSVDG